MTRRAGIIASRHAERAARLVNVHAVGIVALDAVQFPFDHRMMIRQLKSRVGLEMAIETSLGVLAWIYNESPPPSPRRDMAAPGAVTGLAPRVLNAVFRRIMESRMGARGKRLGDVRMTVGTGLVTNENRAFDFRRRHHVVVDPRAGG